MYKYFDADGDYLSLHDCRATKAKCENGILSFVFPEGIWVAPRHPDNTKGKTICTDEALVEFTLQTGNESDMTIYVFNENAGVTTREEWNPERLIECINSGKYTLEFLYKYKGYDSMIIDCWLWSDEKPYSRECELRLFLTGVKYYWNNLQEAME